MTGIIIFLAIAVIVVLIGVNMQKKAKLIKAKMDARGVKSYFSALHVEGLGIATDVLCDIMQFKDRVQIESSESRFQIPIANIRAAAVKTEQELIEKNKSVVGRALVGTLLVPGLGTIVGGMSGIGSKKKKGPKNTYFILNFMNSNGELDAVTFKNNFNVIGAKTFCNEINKAANISRAGQPLQL